MAMRMCNKCSDRYVVKNGVNTMFYCERCVPINVQIIHYKQKMKTGENRYYCNTRYIAKEECMHGDWSKVTCRNCLKTKLEVF